MAFRSVLMIGLVWALAGCGLPPAPANMPPPIPETELQPTSGDPYSAIIEPSGEPILSDGPRSEGDAVLMVPYRYRHTAELTEDVTGFSITVSGTRVKAGAPGYFAGNFGSSGGYGQTSNVRDMWCFFRETGDGGGDGGGDGVKEPLCLLRNDTGVAAIAPTRLSPYLWTSFSPQTGTFDYVHTPIFERREVEMPVELALEYRFDGWDGNTAKVDVYIRGDRVRRLRSSQGSDGGNPAQIVRTLSGDLVLTKQTDNPEAVFASLRE